MARSASCAEPGVTMSERLRIARNWLPRYTGMPLEQFGDFVLLTNFRS